MDTSTPTNTLAAAVAATNYTYHFKSVTPAQFEKLLTEFDTPQDVERVGAEFETVVNSAGREAKKRKSVSVMLSYPTLPEGTPTLVQDWVNGYVASFVKSQYIDNFLPVGEHDLDTIAQVIAASGGRSARFDFTDEQLSAAAKSFGEYVAAKVGNAAIADKLSKVFEAKFSIAAIKKFIGSFDEVTVTKLKGHLESWATWLVDTEEELAEEYGSVFAALDARLAKHLATDSNQNIAEFL